MRSSAAFLCCLLYHLDQKVFISAPQKLPDLLIQCCFCSSSSYLGNFSCMKTRADDCGTLSSHLLQSIHLFLLKAAWVGHPLQCPLYCLLQAAGQAPFSVGWQPVRLHKVCAFPLQHTSSLFKS